MFLGDGDVSMNSTVSVDLAGNCPTKGSGWYSPGTYLSLKTTGSLGTTFSGWTTNAQLLKPASFTENTVFVTPRCHIASETLPPYPARLNRSIWLSAFMGIF